MSHLLFASYYYHQKCQNFLCLMQLKKRPAQPVEKYSKVFLEKIVTLNKSENVLGIINNFFLPVLLAQIQKMNIL